MENLLFRSFLLLLAVEVALLESDGPVVVTKTGRVRGFRRDYKGTPLNVFLGIPYATPPVGDLRFKRTVPVEKWKGTLNCTKLPNACYQVHGKTEDQKLAESEDCLYLNVWIPSTNKSKQRKAVMVWIHGGFFSRGSSALDAYDGSVLSSHGNVVVVSMNYRLGVMGYMTSHTEDAPGNAAMYDQVEALKWINENIDAFGGNSSCITLFGESSGSISVSAHAVSPLSKDLFQRAIMESGSAAVLAGRLNGVNQPTQLNFEFSEQVAKQMGCSTALENLRTSPKTVVNCLREKDPAKMTNLSAPFQFSPQHGDDFLPEDGIEAIRKGDFKNCQLLLGVNADEGSFFIVQKYPDKFGVDGKKEEHPRMSKVEGHRILLETLPLYGIDPVSAEAITEYYLSKAEGDFNEEVLRQVYTAVGDCLMVCPAVYTAEKVAQQGNNVYFYEFVHRPSNSDKSSGRWMGVTHFEEVQFVFGMPLRETVENKEYTREERHLSRKMMKMWTNFAKYGSPHSKWPRYDREHACYRVLNTTKFFRTGRGPHRENCDFIRPIYGFQ